MMHTYRLVRLIETHSEALASNLLHKVQQSASTGSYSKVPPEELRQRVYGIYHNVGDWLLGKREADLERRYREIGTRRYHQQVPLAELVWAIILTKETLWEFLKWESIQDQLVEVFGQLELLQLLGQFFDRAIYYAAVGYEQARIGDHAAKISVGRSS